MIQAVDTHVCGEPGRVIVGGVLDVPGATMFEKRTYLEREADGLRLRMLREPRGYPAANCNLILPPTHPQADAGFVIMEQTEYPGMSGTNTIAVTTVLLETGMDASVLDPASAGMEIASIGIERDGFRKGWMAITASMAAPVTDVAAAAEEGGDSHEDEAEGNAGIYLTRIPGWSDMDE